MEDADNTLDQSSSDDNQTEEQVQGTETEQQAGKRSAEARIHELLAKNKELEAKLDAVEAKIAPVQAPAPTTKQPPEVQKAVDYLKELGFVQKKDQEEAIRAIEDRLVLNNEHMRLESKYSGEDGRPKYDRAAIEEFMRKRGIYDAEVAYETLNKPEIFDWQLKQYESERKNKPFVQKPAATTGVREEKTITPEKISEWLKTPEGRVKYEQNRDKILGMLQKGEL